MSKKKNIKNYGVSSNAATAKIGVDIAGSESNSGKTLVQLNAKAVKTGIKNNMTAEMFAAEYNCTVEDFLGKLSNLFISKTSHDDVMRELRKNESFYKKSTSAGPSKPKKSKETALERAERLIDEIVLQGLPTELEELKKMKEELLEHDAVVLSTKKTHEEVRQELKERIKVHESDIKKLNKSLADKQTELDVAKASYARSGDAIDKYHKIHLKAESRIKVINDAIEKALMPTVFVYEDSIDIEEQGKPVTIGYEGSSDIAKRFMDDEMFNGYRASELKMIAKVLIISRYYSGKVIITFDDAEIESGFAYAIAHNDRW